MRDPRIYQASQVKINGIGSIGPAGTANFGIRKRAKPRGCEVAHAQLARESVGARVHCREYGDDSVGTDTVANQDARAAWLV